MHALYLKGAETQFKLIHRLKRNILNLQFNDSFSRFFKQKPCLKFFQVSSLKLS